MILYMVLYWTQNLKGSRKELWLKAYDAMYRILNTILGLNSKTIEINFQISFLIKIRSVADIVFNLVLRKVSEESFSY